MTRKEFIKLCGILGVGLPFQASITSCNDDNLNNPDFSGKVVIIGAGAGGLSSAYLLNQLGIDFEILEASSVYGGRMRINTEFADFPIPLGAEWLHSTTDEFRKMVNNSGVQVNVDTVNYNSASDTFAFWSNGQLEVSSLDDVDIKFVDYSWFNFYKDYILPSVSNKILYNTFVESINYEGDQIIVSTQNNNYTADKVIVAVPLKILQNKEIGFIPSLPQSKSEAIDNAKIWDGFKAFIEFSEKFYDTQIGFEITPAADGQKLYYDAAYGQNSGRNILGLFTVGTPAQEYMNLSPAQLKDFMLNELDEIYGNQATPNYINHIYQNWNNEPFIKGGYLSDEEDWRLVRELGRSIDDKIYFAGGAYTDGSDWVSVHAAAQSASDAVEELIS